MLPAWVRGTARHWPLIPVLALAAWLRLQDLAPGMYFGDPAEYATVAQSLANDPRDLSYPDVEQFGPTPFVSQPPLVLYLFALAIRVTGSVELGPLLVSALFGTATVAVVYALGTLASSRWTGAAAAAFLAVLPFHVRASREAQLDAAFACLLALSVLAFVWWHRRPSDARAWLAGAALAACAFAKIPGAIAFAIVLPGLLAIAFARRAPPESRRLVARHAAIATAPSAILLALYIGLLWSLRSTSQLLDKVAWQAGRVAGEGTLVRPWHWYFTDADLGLVPQVGILLLLAAPVGLAILLRDLVRRPADRPMLATLAAWPILFLAFLVATQRKEWFYAIPLEPALALLAAWPVGTAVQWALRERAQAAATPAPARAPQRSWAFGVVGLVASAAMWAPVTATMAGAGGYGSGVREAALWIHAQDPEAAQVGTTLGRFTLHMYNGQPTYHVWLNHSFVEDAIRAGHVRYVVVDRYATEPWELAWLEGLTAEHRGEVVWQHRSEGSVAVEVWQLRPGAADPAPGGDLADGALARAPAGPAGGGGGAWGSGTAPRWCAPAAPCR